MWRHGLLLRCKPSYLIFKDPAVSLINKTSFLNPKVYAKNISTKKLRFFPVRSYSKSLSEVLPETSLEVKRTESVEDDIPNQMGKPVKIEDRKGFGESRIDNVIVIQNNAGLIDSEELSLNGIKSVLKGTESTDALTHARPRPRPGPRSPCNEPDSDHKVIQIHNQATRKDTTIQDNENDLHTPILNDGRSACKDVVGLGPVPTETDRPKDTWQFSYLDDEPVRIYDNDQHQMLFEAIHMANELTSEKWDELQKRVLSGDAKPTNVITTGPSKPLKQKHIVTEYNIHGAILDKCIAHKRLRTGLSFLNYISASPQEPNLVIIGKFCRLAYSCASEVDDNIRSIITSSYDSLRARYPTFDASTAENVLSGLCLTKRWKEGLEILDEIRLTNAPSRTSYSALIQASFDNNEPDIGWELLPKMLCDSRLPSERVYESWLQYCKRTAAGNKVVEQRLVEKMLHFLANNDIRLTETAIVSFRLWFEYDAPPEADWNVEFTTVDSRGMCKSCHQVLNRINVTQEEFESLKSVFVEKTIVGSNIFLKSSPEELEDYMKFIRETAPYDVVIDGLNVGYSANQGKESSPVAYAKALKDVVQFFVKRSQRILVLGRRHMDSWPKHHMRFVYENAQVFLADNVSQDDPYLLYATLYSGLGTRFISRDLMRSHTYLLKNPKLQSIFQNWQKQYQLQVMNIDNGYVKFRLPHKYNTSAHCNRNGSWHIPYNLEGDSKRHQAVTSPRQWLCVSRFKERSYDDVNAYGDDSRFTNNRQENRMYSGNNQQSQFRKSRSAENSFDSSDDENGSSENMKRNYVKRAFNDDHEPKFRRTRSATGRYADDDDSGDEEMPSRFAGRNPRQPYNKNESSQFGTGRYVDRRSGGEAERPMFRPASKMAEGEDSSDEHIFRSKPSPSEERLKKEMLESESKQAFKSYQTRGKAFRKDD